MSSNLNIDPLNNWWDSRIPVIISGPCSAESEFQLLETAKALRKSVGLEIFRCGLWKPRTRPGHYEGAGDAAFPWLRSVKSATSMKIAVEVATADHVKKCLDNDIDIIWLGARTVVNPFSVQEIADALIGANIPVMIKNPVSPDLNLWIGAIERINSAGITKIIAVHRGFNYKPEKRFRNDPLWEIPIELKRLIPQIPVICDPSHISGKKEYIREISQKAFNLSMEGLMIESHINPENALTDIAQQVSPAELKNIIENIEYRTGSNSREGDQKLSELREQIDKIDEELFNLLSDRLGLSVDIAKIKKDMNMSALQLNRWQEMLEQRFELCKKYGLDKGFIFKIMEQIHKESIRKQYEILKKK